MKGQKAAARYAIDGDVLDVAVTGGNQMIEDGFCSRIEVGNQRHVVLNAVAPTGELLRLAGLCVDAVTRRINRDIEKSMLRDDAAGRGINRLRLHGLQT